MSSHHFVRAQQASCLCIFGNDIEHDILMQLLEWNPIIIANEQTIDWLLSLDIKIDFFIGDTFDFELPYTPEVWKLDELESVIEKIRDEIDSERIVLVGLKATASIHLCMLKYPQLVCYANDQKKIVIKAKSTFKKWVNAGYKFQIEEATNAKVEGDFESKEAAFITTNANFLIIHSQEDLVFTEWI